MSSLGTPGGGRQETGAGADPTVDSTRRHLAALDSFVPKRPALASLLTTDTDQRNGVRARLTVPLSLLTTVGVAGIVIVAWLAMRQAPITGAAPTVSPTPGHVVAATHIDVLDAYLLEAAWAPDGAHVAIAASSLDNGPSGSPAQQHVLDRAGQPVAVITADGLVWTGPQSYLLTRIDPTTSAIKQTLGQLGTSAETAVATGSVAVAFAPGLPCIADTSGGSYTLWISGREVPQTGYALACTSDRATVAVLHPTGQQDGLETGWIDLVNASTGAVIRELRSASATSQAWAAFSPDGQTLGYVDLNGAVAVADVTTGAARELVSAQQLDGPVTPAWLPDGRLAVPQETTGTVRVFERDGAESSAKLPYGPDLSVSSAGVVLAIDPLATQVAITAPTGTQTTIDLGDETPNGSQEVFWSPDGQEAILVCTTTTVPTSGRYQETAVLLTVSW